MGGESVEEEQPSDKKDEIVGENEGSVEVNFRLSLSDDYTSIVLNAPCPRTRVISEIKSLLPWLEHSVFSLYEERENRELVIVDAEHFFVGSNNYLVLVESVTNPVLYGKEFHRLWLADESTSRELEVVSKKNSELRSEIDKILQNLEAEEAELERLEAEFEAPAKILDEQRTRIKDLAREILHHENLLASARRKQTKSIKNEAFIASYFESEERSPQKLDFLDFEKDGPFPERKGFGKFRSDSFSSMKKPRGGSRLSSHSVGTLPRGASVDLTECDPLPELEDGSEFENRFVDTINCAILLRHQFMSSELDESSVPQTQCVEKLVRLPFSWQFLYAYLVTIHAEENCQFLQQVLKFRGKPTRKRAERIVDDFVRANSDNQINVDDGTRLRIISRFGDIPIKTVAAPEDLFAEAWAEVVRLLRTSSLERFLKSRICFVMFSSAKDMLDNVPRDLTTSPVHMAVRKGKAKQVRALVVDQEISVDFVDNHGNSGLHCAVAESQQKIVNLLLSLDSNPQLKNEDGETPLFMANDPVIARMLIDAGVDTGLLDKRHRPAWHVVPRGVRSILRSHSMRFMYDPKQARKKGLAPHAHFLLWSNDFSVAVKVLDRGHEEIVGAVDRIVSDFSSGSELKELNVEVKELCHTWSLLIMQEDELMQKFAVAGREEHRKAHSRFAGRLKMAAETSRAKEESLLKTIAVMREWLFDHLLEEDMALAESIPYDVSAEPLSRTPVSVDVPQEVV